MDFQNRRPTKNEVKLWFSSLDCNIGTITGNVSGIVVVDADGKEGIESVKKLGIAPTLTARTGGGGYHFFYSIDGHVPSRVRLMPGVDIRGDGGYVVLAPSLHRSGQLYEWIEPINRPVKFDRQMFAGLFNRYEDSNTGWKNELFQGVSEGNRSVSAARLSGHYFSLGLSLEEVWILMCAWNDKNSPPLDESDLKRTVLWAHKKNETDTRPVQIQTLKDIQTLLKRRSYSTNGR